MFLEPRYFDEKKRAKLTKLGPSRIVRRMFPELR
jgi:hypothetical protein